MLSIRNGILVQAALADSRLLLVSFGSATVV
jgi:hypothetical protein